MSLPSDSLRSCTFFWQHAPLRLHVSSPRAAAAASISSSLLSFLLLPYASRIASASRAAAFSAVVPKYLPSSQPRRLLLEKNGALSGVSLHPLPLLVHLLQLLASSTLRLPRRFSIWHSPQGYGLCCRFTSPLPCKWACRLARQYCGRRRLSWSCSRVLCWSNTARACTP